MSSSVEDWLRSLGFIHYTQAFLDNGYDELEICKEIGKEDLDAIGVRNVKDRTDILNAVAHLKQAGTAVYFVLDAGNEGDHLQAQPERETYAPIQLKMMLRDKLEEDKIDLTSSPYSRPDGTEGILDTLVTIYADKFYTYEEHVLTALQSLRQRQAEKQAAVEDSLQQPSPPIAAQRPGSARHSSKEKDQKLQETEDDGRHEDFSEDEGHHGSVFSEATVSPTGMIPAAYLDVDSPAERAKSRQKRRRKVERNTQLSRSLDSLKELHVNVEPKHRERESSSFKSRPFRFKWLHGSKKKHHSVSESKKQALEKRPSNPTTAKDYDLLASAIKMGEEDRMALMIMVKQGELTVEEAVEQLKRYEEDCRKGDYLKPNKDDFPNDEDKSDSKPKLKRGFFGRSTKRKSGSRPSSEVIASEITMGEDDRINLMRCVKNGEMTVDQALKRFISYEEKHKKSDSDDNPPTKQSPRLPKSVSGFSRISIKRVSGVISSSLWPGPTPGEPNSVFYTDAANADSSASMDGSVSSGDEVHGTDSSPAPSPKRHLSNIEGLNQSQHSSSSSVDSVDKTEEKPSPSITQHQYPSFLSEMKVVLGKQGKIGDAGAQPDPQQLRPGKKNEKPPPPPPPARKPLVPLMEAQKVVPLSNSTGSLKKTPPELPTRPGVAVAQPSHRPAPPIPSRPPKNTSNKGKDNGLVDQSERGNLKVGSTEPEITKSSQTEVEMSGKNLREGQTQLEFSKVEQNVVTDTKEVALRRPNRPPPLPPRPPSSSFQEGSTITEACSVETQASPPPPVDTSSQENRFDPSEKLSTPLPPRPPSSSFQEGSTITEACSVETQASPPPPVDTSSQENRFDPSKKLSVPDAVEKPAVKPHLRPKPKPRPKPRPKEDNSYNEVPPPRPVGQTSQEKISQASDDDDDDDDNDSYNEVPPPRPVPGSQEKTEEDSDDQGDEYNEVPPPRPVQAADEKQAEDSDDQTDEYNEVPPPIPVPNAVGKIAQTTGAQDSPYKQPIQPPRPVGQVSPGGTRTRGESSKSDVDTNMERDQRGRLGAKRTEPKASRNEAGGDKLPVPAPRIKRPSHSLGEMVERKLHIEQIDLTQEPYSDHTGCWGVPVNLVDRYSEELHRSHAELAGIIDRLRVRRLRLAQRQAVPCKVSELDFTSDPLGNLENASDWLTSLGLPMYIKSLTEVGYDDMESMPDRGERHFLYAGISDPRHMRRILASVEGMPR